VRQRLVLPAQPVGAPGMQRVARIGSSTAKMMSQMRVPWALCARR
jgi:hypothetical protein